MLDRLISVPNSITDFRVNPGIPRLVEIVIALLGLVIAFPLIILSGAAITLTSKGPVLFRQRRMGRNGRVFVLYKLRTMHFLREGPQVTSGDDARVTMIGKVLRKAKLDELPELWNVLKGDMALVGPRPEVPCFVDLQNPLWPGVLAARPGITDPMTLRLRNEETLLAGVEGDREQFYITTLQPYKLKGYLEYLRTRSWWDDVKVLWETSLAVLFPAKAPPPTVAEILISLRNGDDRYGLRNINTDQRT